MLSLVIFFPILFSAFLLPLRSRKKIDMVAFLGSLLSFALVIAVFCKFDSSVSHLQMVEKFTWFHNFSISYFLGIDGLSLWLVMLTGAFFPFVIFASWGKTIKRVVTFYIALFALQTTLLGTFLAMDSILFYVFFELSLVPMYFLVGLWGYSRRIYSALKLFIFTGAGSLCFLAATVFMMKLNHTATGQISSSLLDFYVLDLPFVADHLFNVQTIVFILFFIAFAVKIPLFPLHTWLPDVHVEAPTVGSALLAAIMLKMGSYGMLRFVIPLAPEASSYYASIVVFIGVFGIIYGALMALAQTDIKKVIAFSSVSHMGYVIVGFFTLSLTGLWGGYYQMLAHAVSSGALFLLIGCVYDKYHTREFKNFGGLAQTAPLFAIVFFIMTLSSIGVPGTAGFVGEFLVMITAFEFHSILGLLTVSGVILGAAYMLLAFKKIFLGPVNKDLKTNPWDMSKKDLVLIVPMVVLVFFMGFGPQIFYKYSAKSLEHFSENYSNYYLLLKKEEGAQ